ncbi:MAG: hypothetical protein KAI47_16705 [Deltaproteobacteria bacterium]|nr:hypothetical protein [Deltaproteobacteria bacterium]
MSCERAVCLEATSAWPIACPACPEGVTFAVGLAFRARDVSGALRTQRWVTTGARPLRDDLALRLGRCMPLALRAMETALRQAVIAADPTLAKAKKRLLRRIACLLPYRFRRGVEVSPVVERGLYELGQRVRQRGGRRLIVTSGIRDPYRQARAMFVKLILGARLLRLYRRKKAVREILSAYRAGRRGHQSSSEVIYRMREVIEGQICRGVYISEHLKAGAVDLRSLGLRRRHKRALRRAVRSFGGRLRLKEEHRPPHFHIAFRDLGAEPDRPAFCAPTLPP